MSNQYILNYWLAGCLLLLLNSCAEPSLSYFPLEEGFKWRYKVSQVTHNNTNNKQQYIIRNIAPSTLNDKPVARRKSIDGTIYYYSQDEQGIQYLGYLTDDGIEQKFNPAKQYVLKFPLQVGAYWADQTITKLLKKTGPLQKIGFAIVVDIQTKVKVESINETVKVAAGIFKHCIRLSITGSDYKNLNDFGLAVIDVKQTNWYAPNVGLVKSERIESIQNNMLKAGVLNIELAEYTH